MGLGKAYSDRKMSWTSERYSRNRAGSGLCSSWMLRPPEKMCGSDDVSTTLPHFSDPRSIVSRVSNSLITSRVSAFTGGASSDSTCTPGTGDADICHAAARDDDGGGAGDTESRRRRAAAQTGAARARTDAARSRADERSSMAGSCGGGERRTREKKLVLYKFATRRDARCVSTCTGSTYR